MTTNNEELKAVMTFRGTEDGDNVEVIVDFPDDLDPNNLRPFELAASAALGFFERLKEETESYAEEV